MPPRDSIEAPSATLSRVLKEWPRLQQYDWNVIDSTRTAPDDMRRIEFYPPEESRNPAPGRPTVEVFDPRLRGEALSGPLAGDMLHYLPKVDPAWKKLRQSFSNSLTPRQREIDQRAYQTHQQQFDEKRPFEQWMDISRLDQYLGVGLRGPVEGSDWSTDDYTPQQHDILKKMRQHLETPLPSSLEDLANLSEDERDQHWDRIVGGAKPTFMP